MASSFNCPDCQDTGFIIESVDREQDTYTYQSTELCDCEAGDRLRHEEWLEEMAEAWERSSDTLRDMNSYAAKVEGVA